MITIIDYGIGNLGSIVNMFKHLGIAAKTEDDPTEIGKATKLLLPGVGSFDTAMRRLRERGLRSILDHKALVEKVPVLGICLGMQMLTKSSEEGNEAGLGWIPASTKRFPETQLKVPHMGWNNIQSIKQNPLSHDLSEESRFYFVHSFYVLVENDQNSFMKTNYGINFDSGIQSENIYGVQFHPEKSHKFGMQILRNFESL